MTFEGLQKKVTKRNCQDSLLRKGFMNLVQISLIDSSPTFFFLFFISAGEGEGGIERYYSITSFFTTAGMKASKFLINPFLNTSIMHQVTSYPKLLILNYIDN